MVSARKEPNGTTSSCGVSKPRVAVSILSKGRQVYVEGSIRTRSYDDKSGNKRYITEIVAQRIQFLGGGGGTRLAQQTEAGPGDEMGGGTPPPMDDDIPF